MLLITKPQKFGIKQIKPRQLLWITPEWGPLCLCCAQIYPQTLLLVTVFKCKYTVAKNVFIDKNKEPGSLCPATCVAIHTNAE